MIQPATPRTRRFTLGLAFAFLLSMTACHKRPSVQAPLLHRSGMLKDLNAIRAEDQVWISWTVPPHALQQLAKRGATAIQLCRPVGPDAPCRNVGTPVPLQPAGSFSEMLPAELLSGPPRALIYTLELATSKGKSMILSDQVGTVAGVAPPPLRGLTAELHSQSVLLRWPILREQQTDSDPVVRVYRKLLSNAGGTSTQAAGAADATFETPSDQGQFSDTSVQLGAFYQYLVQRVAKVKVADHTLDLTGGLSVPVCVRISPPEQASAQQSSARDNPAKPTACPETATN